LTVIFQDNPGKLIQNVSILEFTGAKDDGSGGDDWSYNTCKAPVKSSPPTTFHRPNAIPVAQSTVSDD